MNGEARYLVIDVIIGALLIVIDRIVGAKIVEAEAWWRAVVVEEDPREEVRLPAQVGAGLPHHLGRALAEPVALVLVVDPAEEDAVDAELGEDGGEAPGVAERVDLPGHARVAARAERVVEEAVAPGELVHDGLVAGARLVVHAPRAADELQLPAAHQLLHLVLERVVLVLPPFHQEGGLYLDEPATSERLDVFTTSSTEKKLCCLSKTDC